jgi:mannose-6-phosphate isomerase-like protein (cupin superfamily)
MKKMAIEEAKAYTAPKHFDVRSLRLQGKDETGVQHFWVGLSHFLPAGGAEMDATPVEKVYVVTEGEITVRTADAEVVLRKNDSLYIGPNEAREVFNHTNMPCSMLVVINYPDAN